MQYPHVFEDPVLENIKAWVMDETARFPGEETSWKLDSGRKEASDHEMIKTYSTGLLAVALAGYVLACDSMSLFIHLYHFFLTVVLLDCTKFYLVQGRSTGGRCADMWVVCKAHALSSSPRPGRCKSERCKPPGGH